MTPTAKRSQTSLGAKRVFDVVVAGLSLLVLSPFLVIAAVGIRVTSPGPIFYMAHRIGKGGHPFAMLKFRTMHVDSDKLSAITSPDDKRIFGFGLLLRRLKIDELPQFWNILVGDMSLVGPRPEDPKIVARDYTDWMKETLQVAPGVTSPGAVYGYLFGDALLEDADPEGSYARNLLPPKLALERAYMDRAGFVSDLGYVLLTAWAIVAHVLGRQVRLPQADIDAAHYWAPQGPYPDSARR